MIPVVVFVCGGAVMALELAGSRVLAPYAGTSLAAWTGLIGVILASLSVGYWRGGRIADRRPSPGTLAFVVFAAGVCVGLTAWLRDAVLAWLQPRLADPGALSVCASLLLLAPANLFLGMVTPCAVRLGTRDVARAGTTAGRVYALSSAGSIAGTFLTGFVLLPRLGTAAVLLAIAAALTACSIAVSASRWGWGRAAAVCALAACARLLPFGLPDDLLADVDTAYNRVWIRRGVDGGTGRSILILSTDPWGEQSAVFLDGDDLVFECMRFFRLAAHFSPGFTRTLMIGGAGYAYAGDYLRRFPDATLDVVEIDPGLTRLSRRYFGLEDDPRLVIRHEDGRTFLNRTAERYDVIILDAFRDGVSPPHHLVTAEAARRMREVLADGGVVIANVIGAIDGRDGRFTRALLATMREVFPAVDLFPVDDPTDPREVQNIILIARKSEAPGPDVSRDPELAGYLAHRWTEPVAADLPVLTDDRAPVEYYLSGVRPE
ncbi:MAG: fused MFS/spermidine synthase [bacterium]|nr:fused MFS/spermidine synthase [bacterium]